LGIKYESVAVRERGGPEVMAVVESERLESGRVTGNVVLLAPEML
jgi:hypothetical protein